MPDAKKTILITGGAGFIGSHLCDYFINQGNKVICVDSFFSGKKENISHLLNNKNFTLIKHNIIYPLKLKLDKLDEIYHLACPASPVQYQFDPILTLRTSVDGTMNVLNLARKYNAKVLYTSTSEVYGDPLEHPQKETYFGNVDSLGKRACYDEGKRAAECLCKDYNKQFGVDVRVVRLFNVYGPRMMFNDGRVISNFVLQALLSEDITVHGNGQQSRSFMYIDDLIVALEKTMNVEKEKIGIGPINLGNPDERTMVSLAKDIKNISLSRGEIVFVDYEKIPERFGDPQRRCPDINKAKELLNWEPNINFSEGLRKTIDDFKKRLNNKTKVVVFIPGYYPYIGPAETAVKEIIERMSAYEFDLITCKFKAGLPSQEKIGRVNIYRVGWGNKFDKYFLPIAATIKAVKLHRQNNYAVAWGIMASYGSLAALFFSLFSKVAMIVSLYENKIDYISFKRRLYTPLYKMIFRKAHRLQLVADLTEQQLAWLEDDKNISPVDLDKGWDYVTKKTREEFQKLEILSSRL
jgi:UDP-glucuronate decarboxylase